MVWGDTLYFVDPLTHCFQAISHFRIHFSNHCANNRYMDRSVVSNQDVGNKPDVYALGVTGYTP